MIYCEYDFGLPHPKSIHAQNIIYILAAKVKVLVNNEQCGNVMSSNLPDRTPILFQCNSVVGIRGDIIRIIRFGETPSSLSLYEIEVYAHPNELGIIMAEGDFGEKWMNNLLLGTSSLFSIFF